MKKLINVSMVYAILAMVGGVFFREFTKFNNFTEVTSLGKLHTHLFMLGMFMFLVVALFAQRLDITAQKSYKVFFVTYNIGVVVSAIMLTVRGVTQVLYIQLSSGASAAISGVAGISHIFIGVGIISLFLALKKCVKEL